MDGREDEKEEPPMLLTMTHPSTLVTDKLPADPKEVLEENMQEVNRAGGSGTSGEQELFSEQFEDLQVSPSIMTLKPYSH